MNSNKAIDHNAILYSLPSIAPPISAAIAEVKFVVGDNKLSGNAFILPITIATANASPNARARPKTIAVIKPDFDAGRTTLLIVCQRVAPKP